MYIFVIIVEIMSIYIPKEYSIFYYQIRLGGTVKYFVHFHIHVQNDTHFSTSIYNNFEK